MWTSNHRLAALKDQTADNGPRSSLYRLALSRKRFRNGCAGDSPCSRSFRRNIRFDFTSHFIRYRNRMSAACANTLSTEHRYFKAQAAIRAAISSGTHLPVVTRVVFDRWPRCQTVETAFPRYTYDSLCYALPPGPINLCPYQVQKPMCSSQDQSQLSFGKHGDPLRPMFCRCGDQLTHPESVLYAMLSPDATVSPANDTSSAPPPPPPAKSSHVSPPTTLPDTPRLAAATVAEFTPPP